MRETSALHKPKFFWATLYCIRVTYVLEPIYINRRHSTCISEALNMGTCISCLWQWAGRPSLLCGSSQEPALVTTNTWKNKALSHSVPVSTGRVIKTQHTVSLQPPHATIYQPSNLYWLDRRCATYYQRNQGHLVPRGGKFVYHFNPLKGQAYSGCGGLLPDVTKTMIMTVWQE